jgi:hypothetical protein
MRARTSRGRGGRAGGLAAPGQPVPVAPEAGAVPAHDRIRLDDGEALGPTTPESAQQDPEEPVGGPKDRASSTGQGGKLLAEGQVLDDEVASRAQGRAERRQEGREEAKHRAGENLVPGPNRQWFQRGRGSGERQRTARSRCGRRWAGPPDGGRRLGRSEGPLRRPARGWRRPGAEQPRRAAVAGVRQRRPRPLQRGRRGARRRPPARSPPPPRRCGAPTRRWPTPVTRVPPIRQPARRARPRGPRSRALRRAAGARRAPTPPSRRRRSARPPRRAPPRSQAGAPAPRRSRPCRPVAARGRCRRRSRPDRAADPTARIPPRGRARWTGRGGGPRRLPPTGPRRKRPGSPP